MSRHQVINTDRLPRGLSGCQHGLGSITDIVAAGVGWEWGSLAAHTDQDSDEETQEKQRPTVHD